jgi:MEMO1 family protein
VSRSRGVRRPVVAGTFYPADGAELAATVDALLERATPAPVTARGLVALVAPHAGYAYSGAVAASALVLARNARRVVLLGPSHFVPLDGLAVSGADAWETPLGSVAIAADLRARAVAAGAVVDDGPHDREHALEVELPFLQRACSEGLEILAVAVGRSGAGEVASFLDALDGLLIVSTDLSHSHPDAVARELDRRTAGAVVARDPDGVGDDAACGVFALRGLAEHARRQELGVELLDLRTSADGGGGDAQRVIGYGAFALREPVASTAS